MLDLLAATKRISRYRVELLQESSLPWKPLSLELSTMVDLDPDTENIIGTVLFASMVDEVIIIELNDHRDLRTYFALSCYSIAQETPVLLQFLLSKGINILSEEEVFDE